MAHFIKRPDTVNVIVPYKSDAFVCMTAEELKTIPMNVPCTYIVEDLRFDGTALTVNAETRVVEFSVSYVGPAGKYGSLPPERLHLNLSLTPTLKD